MARLSGIRVDWIKIGVYVLCGALAALTGLLYLARAGVGDPVTGEGAELQAITAVILGGTSLFGGQDGLIGTLGGVLLVGLTNNVLVILNVSLWYQELIQGLVIVSKSGGERPRRRRIAGSPGALKRDRAGQRKALPLGQRGALRGPRGTQLA